MAALLTARPATGEARRRPPHPDLTTLRSVGLLALACLLPATACSDGRPLAFVPQTAPIGHDGAEVLDLAVLDVEGDGVLELVAARPDGLHLLRRSGGIWQDATPGTGLERVTPVETLVAAGRDLLVTRAGRTVRLVASDVGTWSEAPAAGTDTEPDPATETDSGSGAQAAEAPATPRGGGVQVDADLNGDGALDRALVDGRVVRVLLRDVTGTLGDVTTRVASDALPLQGPGRRILAADLDGDGDVDLVVAAGRLLLLLSNGGTLSSDVRT
jgi:hypothetical protein